MNKHTLAHIKDNALNRHYRHIEGNTHVQHNIAVHGNKTVFSLWYSIDDEGKKHLVDVEGKNTRCYNVQPTKKQLSVLLYILRYF